MKLLLACVVLLLTTTAAHAKVVTKTITYKHGDVELQGYLAYDDALEGKRPGVLVVHEWWGLNDYARKRVRMLAELGYVAFAADMYGKGKVTADPKQAGEWAGHMRGNLELWRARAMEALKVLNAQPQADTTRTGAIGYCFGGSTVLQLAISGADLDAVVSFHGSPKPFAPKAEIKARVLVCHGADDAFIKPADEEGFIKAMNKAEADWQWISYGGAVHSFTNPGADAHGIDGVKYNKAADHRSWAHMKLLFDEAFASSTE